MKFGWKAGPEQFDPQYLLDCSIEAERAGFDFIDSSDHFHPWSEEGNGSFVWTWFGAVAAKTKTIEMGPCVTSPIIRYHPAIIAQAAVTVALLSNNRFYLGIGTGEALNEYSSTGIWPGYVQRQSMMGEAIMIMKSLWTGDEVTFEGDYYNLKKAKLYTLPSQSIPLYISSLDPGSSYFAGNHGDGLITVGGKNPTIYTQIMKEFKSGAKDNGKNTSTMPHLIELGVEYTDHPDEVLQTRKKYWAGTLIPALFNQNIYTPAMSAKNGEPVGSDTMKKSYCISDNPEDFVLYVIQYNKIGFTHLIFHSAQMDQIGFIQKFGHDILPKLRVL